MTTKANSRLYETSETEPFLLRCKPVATGFRGELRILPNILDGAFCKYNQKLKAAYCTLNV